MTDTSSDHQHFANAVVQLGEQQEVVATQAIYNTQGLKIIDQGVAINSALYERLMRHTLATPLEESVHSSSTVTGETLKDSAEAIMRDTPFFGRMAADEKTRKMLLNVIETIPLPDAMAFQLTVAHQVRPEIYLHLVRTGLTAAWLARTPLVSRYDLGMAAAQRCGRHHRRPDVFQP